MFDLENTSATAACRLHPIGGSWYLFSRMRILVRGQILKYIDMYHRVHEMFNLFRAAGRRYNDDAEGFRDIWEGFGDNNAQTLAGANNNSVVSDAYRKRVPRAMYQTVLLNPSSGNTNIFQSSLSQSLSNCLW